VTDPCASAEIVLVDFEFAGNQDFNVQSSPALVETIPAATTSLGDVCGTVEYDIIVSDNGTPILEEAWSEFITITDTTVTFETRDISKSGSYEISFGFYLTDYPEVTSEEGILTAVVSSSCSDGNSLVVSTEATVDTTQTLDLQTGLDFTMDIPVYEDSFSVTNGVAGLCGTPTVTLSVTKDGADVTDISADLPWLVLDESANTVAFAPTDLADRGVYVLTLTYALASASLTQDVVLSTITVTHNCVDNNAMVLQAASDVSTPQTFFTTTSPQILANLPTVTDQYSIDNPGWALTGSEGCGVVEIAVSV
jgi:hypothetical protein